MDPKVSKVHHGLTQVIASYLLEGKEPREVLELYWKAFDEMLLKTNDAGAAEALRIYIAVAKEQNEGYGLTHQTLNGELRSRFAHGIAYGFVTTIEVLFREIVAGWHVSNRTGSDTRATFNMLVDIYRESSGEFKNVPLLSKIIREHLASSSASFDHVAWWLDKIGDLVGRLEEFRQLLVDAMILRSSNSDLVEYAALLSPVNEDRQEEKDFNKSFRLFVREIGVQVRVFKDMLEGSTFWGVGGGQTLSKVGHLGFNISKCGKLSCRVYLAASLTEPSSYTENRLRFMLHSVGQVAFQWFRHQNVFNSLLVYVGECDSKMLVSETFVLGD